jgi:hypothetical protein
LNGRIVSRSVAMRITNARDGRWTARAQDERINPLERNIDMKLKLALVTAALLASFGAHAVTPEHSQPDGRVLERPRNTATHNGISANGMRLSNGLGMNGLKLENGLSVNGLNLNNGLSVNGFRMTNGIGINGLMLKNSEHLGDAEMSTGLDASAGRTLMPQVVGIVFAPEATKPSGRVLEGSRINGLHLNGLRLSNTATHNGWRLNGLRLNNALSMNGLHLNNGIQVNGFRMKNGIGINGLMLKNSEPLGDAEMSTGVHASAGPELMPQVVGIVFDRTRTPR